MGFWSAMSGQGCDEGPGNENVRFKARLGTVRAGKGNPMIHATCHTADNVLSFEFDASPWFSEADAPSIIDLARREWASTAIAESLERRRGYERLHDLVEYAAERLQPESLEDPTWETFECIVDGPEALAWLEKNRPDVAARIPSQSRYQR
jgi:hypothetical protein